MSTEVHSASPLVRRVLLVIPTLNEAKGIEQVINRLSEDLPDDAEVSFVVADGGSTDGTVDIVQHLARTRPQLQFLHNPQRIQSAAVNLAVRTFGQDAQVLVRCDAHASYPRGFVRSLLQTLASTGADAVVVPMDSSGHNCVQRAIAWVSDSKVGSGGSAHRGGQRSGYVDHGHHAAFRMESFLRAGGYDESFTHNEDAELDCRQRRLGSKLYLDATIRLGYQPRSTIGGLARQYFAYGRGRSRTVRRHPGSMRLRQAALPVHLVVSVLALVLAAWVPWLLLWPLAYLAVMATTSLVIALRQRSVCGLLAGVTGAVMHLSWAAGFVSGILLVREAPWKVAAVASFEGGRGG
jgi:succinoglycan biosynthesis protein ExoA